MIVADGVTLINKGTIEIGGILGAGSGGPSGCTAGNYSELILGNNSKLINYNRVNVYGYLGEKSKGTSSILIQPSSDSDLSNIRPTMYMPLYWHDFCGGSSLKAIYDAIDTRYCMPIDDFYFENVTPKTIIYGGSDMISWTNIYAAKNNAEYDLKLIGSDSSGIINLPENSYLISQYDEKTFIDKLHFYGDASFNALSINVEKAIKDTAGFAAWLAAKAAGIPSNVTSDSGYFPVSYHYDITLDKLPQKHSAIFDGSSNKYKFLNGSCLTVCDDITLNVSSLVAYKGDDYFTGRSGLANNLQKSKTPLNPAGMLINGKLNGDLVAGTFESNKAGSMINAKSNSSVTMYEPKSGSGSAFDAKMLDGEEGWYYLPISLNLKNESGQYEERTSGIFNFNGNYWTLSESKEIVSVSLESNAYESSEGKKGNFGITLSINPSDHDCDILSYTWNCSPSDATLTVSDDNKSATLATPANNSTELDKTYTVTCSVKYRTSEGEEKEIIGTRKYTAKKKNSCVTGDTMVSMADGSFKMIKDLTYDDEVLAYNHFSGQTVKTKAAIIFKHPAVAIEKIKVSFEDGTFVNVLGNHEFFDATLNRYVEINDDNFENYIGHEFVKIPGLVNSKAFSRTKLINVSVSKTTEEQYSVQSSVEINFITNCILSRTVPAVEGWFDYFEFGETLVYDEQKVASDITKYGLYKYEDFEHLGVSYDQFIAFNGPYLKVLVGKGIVTYEKIVELIGQYVI